MDWNSAIERNREALKRILASLVAMASLGSTVLPLKDPLHQGVAQAENGKLSPAFTLPRHLHRAVLRLLRPAEAATRRLIIVMARGLVERMPLARPGTPKRRSTILRNGVGTGIVMSRNALAKPQHGAVRTLSLPLLDPLPRWSGRRRPPMTSGVPRISFPGFTERFPVQVRRPPSADDPVSAARLASRLSALASALDDLPAQARRFARWRSRLDAASPQSGKQRPPCAGRRPFRRVWPLRPGYPPGWRRKPVHEVDDVLNDLHGLAFWALESPDTS